MAPYVGEIRMFAGNFAPAGWMFCEGQVLPISEYETLFQLVGTTYGGDGQDTFALPDLRGRVPVHMGTASSGTSYTLGEQGGVEEVTLTVQQIPVHGHRLLASTTPGTVDSPAGALVGTSATTRTFVGAAATAGGGVTLDPVGGSQPHHNVQPYLCVHHIISLFGVFPSQT